MEGEVLGLLGISAGSYLGAKITQRTTLSDLPDSLGLLEARADELLSASGETLTPLASAATALRAAAVAVKAEIAQARGAAKQAPSPT